jgi:hypothetical protein
MQEFSLPQQLAHAKKIAEEETKTMFVFQDVDAGKNWWFSGRLPEDAIRHYKVFPNGEIDRSKARMPKAEPSWHPTVLEGVAWTGALAPFAVTAIMLCLTKSWEAAVYGAWVCVPMSALSAFLMTRSSKERVQSAMMASNLVVYAHLDYYAAIMLAMPTYPMVVLGALMLGAIMSGYGILTFIDNQRQLFAKNLNTSS